MVLKEWLEVTKAGQYSSRIVVPINNNRNNNNNNNNNNNIWRRIFGSKKDKNGEWRRRHKEELHSLYHSPNIGTVIDL